MTALLHDLVCQCHASAHPPCVPCAAAYQSTNTYDEASLARLLRGLSHFEPLSSTSDETPAGLGGSAVSGAVAALLDADALGDRCNDF
jgi:hypothetical protein